MGFSWIIFEYIYEFVSITIAIPCSRQGWEAKARILAEVRERSRTENYPFALPGLLFPKRDVIEVILLMITRPFLSIHFPLRFIGVPTW